MTFIKAVGKQGILTYRKYEKAQCGGTVSVIVISIFLIIAVLLYGMSISTQIFRAKMEVENAADSAALAGAQSLNPFTGNGDTAAACTEFALRNGAKLVSFETGFDDIFRGWVEVITVKEIIISVPGFSKSVAIKGKARAYYDLAYSD